MNNCLECEKLCKNKFCSCSCNVTFQNKKRKSNFSTKKSKCKKCNRDINVGKRATSNNVLCSFCRLIKTKIEKKKSCDICNEIVKITSKYCKSCRIKQYSSNGRKSALKQSISRRSWSEIEFGNLCKIHFKNVTFNDAIFPNDPPTESKWDADVLLHEFKIAILWNGPWHYKKILQNHSLEQVKKRDEIKIQRITDFGWKFFIIKDEKGKKSKKFVEYSFNELLNFIKNVSI